MSGPSLPVFAIRWGLAVHPRTGVLWTTINERDRRRPIRHREVPPHSAPLGLAFYSGAAFTAAYRESLFVAMHGSRPELPSAG